MYSKAMTRVPGFELPSPVRSGILARLLAVLALSALVWTAILWAMA